MSNPALERATDYLPTLAEFETEVAAMSDRAKIDFARWASDRTPWSDELVLGTSQAAVRVRASFDILKNDCTVEPHETHTFFDPALGWGLYAWRSANLLLGQAADVVEGQDHLAVPEFADVFAQVASASEIEPWAVELIRSVGREFDLREKADCRRLDEDGAPVAKVILAAGTRVRLIESFYDSMATRQFHRLAVLSGPTSGTTVIWMVHIGSVPWQ